MYDFAIVSVAVRSRAKAASGRKAASSSVASSPVPYRAKVVEDALVGKDVKATVRQAAAQIRTVARPMSLNAYKVDMAQNLIERVMLKALG